MKSTYKVRVAIAYKANLIAVFVNISLFLASKNDYGRLSTQHASHVSERLLQLQKLSAKAMMASVPCLKSILGSLLKAP